MTERKVVTSREREVAPVPGYGAWGAERHHPSALVQHLLTQAGLPLTEPEVCGIGGGIGFMYAVFEYAAVPHPLLTIVAQHHPQPWAPAVLDRLGVRYIEQHSSSTAAALTKLRRELDAGRACLCTVDRSALPWHQGVPALAAADPYPVAVAGTDGDTFVIDDLGDRPLRIEAADFGRAWAGHRKGRHHLLSIAAVPERVEFAAAVRSAIRTTTAHLTGPVLGNSFDVNFGFSGLGRLIGDLRATTGKSAWIHRFAESFDYAMGRLADCLQREYTAPDATRPIYADFLDLVAPSTDLPELPRAAAAIRQSGEGWAAVTAQARAAVGTSDRRRALDALADLIDGGLAAERAAVDLLEAIA